MNSYQCGMNPCQCSINSYRVLSSRPDNSMSVTSCTTNGLFSVSVKLVLLRDESFLTRALDISLQQESLLY